MRILSVVYTCTRRLTDRPQDSDSCDVGSIPAGCIERGIILMKKKKDIVIEINFNLNEYLHSKLKYVVEAAVLMVFLIVLACACGNGGSSAEGGDSSDATESHATESDVQKEYDQLSQNDEVTAFLRSYYDAYAEGDTDTLETLAYPISESEKGYIKVLSEYIESYDNLQVYTKQGYDADSYFVSVVYDIKFKDVDTLNPSMDFFYICTDDEGKLYIDNVYSNYNMTSGETEADENVTSLILAFENAGDVVALQSEVQEAYDAALEADESLEEMMNETIPDALTKWAEEEAKAAAEKEAAAEEEAEEASEESDEESDKDADSDKESGSDADDESDKTSGNDEDADSDSGKDDSAESKSEAEEDFPFEKGDKIRLIESVNIRSEKSTKSDRVGLAFSGEYVKVIKCYSSGWTKVKWSGKTGYVKTSILEEQL